MDSEYTVDAPSISDRFLAALGLQRKPKVTLDPDVHVSFRLEGTRGEVQELRNVPGYLRGQGPRKNTYVFHLNADCSMTIRELWSFPLGFKRQCGNLGGRTLINGDTIILTITFDARFLDDET